LISTATSCLAQARSTDRRCGARIRDGLQQAICLRPPIELEAAVDTGDNEVELVEYVVR
jgi:hypothetical protein